MSSDYDKAKTFIEKNIDSVREYRKEIAELQKQQENLYDHFLQKYGISQDQKPLVDYIWDALMNDFGFDEENSPTQ